MKRVALSFLFLVFTLKGFCQTIVSGRYSNGLNLAYDSSSNLLTGYYENYTGINADNSAPLFSCIFYIEGVVDNDQASIITHYPNDISEIRGVLKIINNKEVEMQLLSEHGGCFNVQHFSDGPVKFELEEKSETIRIGYVAVKRSYLYKERKASEKSSAYLIERDVFFIDKVDHDWCHGTFNGETQVSGWMKCEDLGPESIAVKHNNASVQDGITSDIETNYTTSDSSNISVLVLEGAWEELNSKNMIYLMKKSGELVLTDSAYTTFYFYMDSLGNVSTNGVFPQWPPPSCHLELLESNRLKVTYQSFGASGRSFIYIRKKW